MKRILFVDDEPLLLEVIEARLEERADEWEMDFAGDADAALNLMTRNSYDVIVVDRRMPGMNGAELLALVRQNHPGTMRIMMSGVSEESPSPGPSELAHQYLSKPCNLDDLEAAIDQTLKRREILLSRA